MKDTINGRTYAGHLVDAMTLSDVSEETFTPEDNKEQANFLLQLAMSWGISPDSTLETMLTKIYPDWTQLV